MRKVEYTLRSLIRQTGTTQTKINATNTFILA